MNPIDKRVTQKFTAFEKEEDPTLLYEALELIEAAERDVQAWDATARRQAVALRLGFLTALDRHIDPQWDPEDKPVKGAPPPPTTHGVVYPSGEVDPATIPDPAVRARYEQALKESKEYARHYDVQLQLRRIEERAVRFLERLLAERYTDSPEDRQELEDLLAASAVGDAHKQRLRDLMPKRAA